MGSALTGDIDDLVSRGGMGGPKQAETLVLVVALGLQRQWWGFSEKGFGTPGASASAISTSNAISGTVDADLTSLGLLIGGVVLILCRQLLTTVNSYSQKALRREGYSRKERTVSEWYLIAFGTALALVGVLDLFNIVSL